MPVPHAVLAVVGEDAVWSSNHEGQSGEVQKTSGAKGSFYVKHGEDAVREYHRSRWLSGRVPVPTIAAFEDPWLVFTDMRAPSLLTDPTAAGEVMGLLLRRLHSLPVHECPFDSRLPVLVEQARQQVDGNRVDPTDFDDDHGRSTPGELLELLIRLQPTDEDLVVTHGDFTPANVLVRPDRSPVLIDLSRVGLADRHRDLALAHRDLSEDFGNQAVESFMAAYGLVPKADPDRLYWYRLLDEFF